MDSAWKYPGEYGWCLSPRGSISPSPSVAGELVSAARLPSRRMELVPP